MRSSTLVAGLWLSLFIVDDVQAYLDPGAGSIVLQAIIAAVAGGFIVMRTYWSKMKHLFTRRKAQDVAEANPSLATERQADRGAPEWSALLHFATQPGCATPSAVGVWLYSARFL